MIWRNRTVLIAIGLLAVLSLAPAPSHAVSLRESGIPMADTLERAWSWLTAHLPGGTPQERRATWRKEGGMINPNGNPLITILTSPPQDNSDEGGMINPNGNH